MKAIFVTFLAILFWAFVGHFFSSFTISTTAFYLPIVFFVIAVTIGKEANKYIYICLCFALILLNDYLFRLYGGGIHDDAGRGICELVFYATLIISTLVLLVLKILDSSKKSKLKVAKKIFLDVFFILALSLLTLLFFIKFNISI
jgi:hypothetical protein